MILIKHQIRFDENDYHDARDVAGDGMGGRRDGGPGRVAAPHSGLE
mgnify:CR=1 FL=1